MDAYRTPLSRARGHGAARHGVGQWIGERVSSIALIPLGGWFVYAALTLAGADHAAAAAFVGQPLNAVLTTLLVLVSFWHMHAGMRVIVEDYVEGGARSVLLILNLFVCVLIGALAAFSILKVALGGA